MNVVKHIKVTRVEELNVGDKVYLASGGPEMTVHYIPKEPLNNRYEVSCVWFHEDREGFYGDVPLKAKFDHRVLVKEALEKAD